jgi:hypothetical protein
VAPIYYANFMYNGWLGYSALREYKAGLFLTGSSDEQLQKMAALRAFESVFREIVISKCFLSVETARKQLSNYLLNFKMSFFY